MNLNIQNKKLGKNYLFDVFSSLGLDTNVNKNSRIRKYVFNIINLGTLRKPIPTAVLERQVFFNDSFRQTQILNESIVIKSDEKYYKCVTNFNIQTYGDFSNFAPFKIRFDFRKTDFFKPSFGLTSNYSKNVNLNTPFTRLNIPKNLSNTTSLSGTNYIYNGFEATTIVNNNVFISGYDSGINNLKRNTFLYTGISGHSGYVAYPQTILTHAYPRYNIDSILSINSMHTYQNNNNDMKGLLVISTGNTASQKIVYVSPHGVSKITGQTLVETLRMVPSKIQSTVVGLPLRYVYQKVWSGINVNFLDVDSQYSNNEPVFESGLYFDNISGLSLKGCLRQKTPLKDTIFYKLYNSFYSGSKTLNTGTWDGIIPANINFVVEYITTKNQVVGTNNEFKLFYKNYGDNSYIDQQLQSGLFDSFESYGYGLDQNKDTAIQNSNKNLRRSINNKYNSYSKNIMFSGIPLMVKNSKYSSFLKFISGLNI
jgi:hypothetical protein